MSALNCFEFRKVGYISNLIFNPFWNLDIIFVLNRFAFFFVEVHILLGEVFWIEIFDISFICNVFYWMVVLNLIEINAFFNTFESIKIEINFPSV